MAIQTITVEIKGVSEVIEFEDDMPFGVFEKIIKKSANIQNEENLLDNVQQNRMEIMLNSIISFFLISTFLFGQSAVGDWEVYLNYSSINTVSAFENIIYANRHIC